MPLASVSLPLGALTGFQIGKHEVVQRKWWVVSPDSQ